MSIIEISAHVAFAEVKKLKKQSAHCKHKLQARTGEMHVTIGALARTPA